MFQFLIELCNRCTGGATSIGTIRLEERGREETGEGEKREGGTGREGGRERRREREREGGKERRKEGGRPAVGVNLYSAGRNSKRREEEEEEE